MTLRLTLLPLGAPPATILADLVADLIALSVLGQERDRYDRGSKDKGTRSQICRAPGQGANPGTLLSKAS